MTPARGDRFQLAPGGNAAEEIQALPTFPKSPADLSQALSGLVPVLHHCQFYAADHAAESAGVEDAAASSSSGGCQSDTKGGARLDAMPLASAGSRISHGGDWDEVGWQRGSSGSCSGRRWAGASGWLGKGVVGRKGDDRKALFQRQDSAEQLTSLPRRAVQLLATRSKSSVAKTCFSAGSLNLELQASSEVRATCGHDGCGAIVATGDGSGRGVGGTELGSGPYRLRTAAAVVIQCVLRGNLARRQVATSDRYHDVCVRHARLIQADERPVTGEMLARMQLTVDEERRRRAEAEGELAAAQEQLRGARAAVRKLEEDRVAMEQEALGLGDQLVRQAVEHAQVDVRDGGPRRGGRQLRKAQLRRQAAAAGVDVAAWTAVREQQQRTSAQAAVLNEGSRKGALYVSEAHARRRFEEAARTAGIQVSACAMMAVTVRERSTAGSGGGYPGNGGDCRTGSS